MPYEFLEHTGDVKIRATGSSFREALESAMQALIQLISSNEAPGLDEEDEASQKNGKSGLGEKKAQTKKASQELLLEVETSNIKDLVVMALERLFVMCEIEDVLPRSVKILEEEHENPYYVRFAVFGEKGKLSDTEIKAITYHQLRVDKTDDGWLIEVVIDI